MTDLENTETKVSFLKKLTEKFWVFRGFIGCFFLIQLLVDNTVFELHEILTVIHVLIVKWNFILSKILSLIPDWWFLPPIKPWFINGVILIGLYIPLYHKILKADDEHLSDLGIFGIRYRPFVFKPKYYSLVMAVSTLLPFLLVYLVFGDADDKNEKVPGTHYLITYIKFSVIFVIFILSYHGHKAMFRGIISGMVAILLLEALYWMNTPLLKDWVNEASQQIMQETSSDMND